MKKEFNLNKFFVSAIAITLTILVITIFVLTIVTHRTNILFYNIPAAQVNAFTKIIEQNYNKKINVIQTDDTILLSQQQKKLKNADILIAQFDSEIQKITQTQKIQQFPQEILSGMPMSISQSIPKKNNKIDYISLLYDMYQTDVNWNYFLQSPIKKIEIWQDLENFGETLKTKINAPMILPFADDKEFINIFGQLMEALTSPQEYQMFYNNLNTAFYKDVEMQKENLNQIETQPQTNIITYLQSEIKNNLSVIPAKKSQKTEPKTLDLTAAEKTLQTLKNLLQKQIIRKEILTQNLQENLFYTDNQICGIFFTKLSDHRKIERTVINNYKSAYFPSATITDNRKFCAFKYTAIQLKKDKKIKQLIQDLSDTLQTELSTATGLAPVQKNCQVPDRQADDVRYWLAASKGALNPLSCAVPAKKTQTEVADFLRTQLK